MLGFQHFRIDNVMRPETREHRSGVHGAADFGIDRRFHGAACAVRSEQDIVEFKKGLKGVEDDVEDASSSARKLDAPTAQPKIGPQQ